MYDVVEFDVWTNAKYLYSNIKLQGRPSDLQDKVKEVVRDYWYVFCEDGFRQPIQGSSFQIYTGNHLTIWCKPLRYVPCDSEVMRNLIERLDKNDVVEEDDRPSVALAFLDTKPHQKNMPLHEYQWRMCVSYQKLNQVIIPFTFPIPRWNYSVQDIDT